MNRESEIRDPSRQEQREMLLHDTAIDERREDIALLAAHFIRNIAKEVGKYKADTHAFTVNVSDGQLNLSFVPVPGKKLPLVNAIRVTRQ